MDHDLAYKTGMTPEQAILHWQTNTGLAKALGIRAQVVHNWNNRGKIPLERQLQIEDLSGGKLKADRAYRRKERKT